MAGGDNTVAITGEWEKALHGEFAKPYYRELYKTVLKEYRTREIYPPSTDIFNAFKFTPLENVKVVIIGQDPYHGTGQANGLCFSVHPGIEIPPSLVNIYKELSSDLGCYIPNNGDLTYWAEQGVMLLNTVLTVRAHQKKALIHNPKHLVVESVHPSPLSAYNGFFGSRPFSRTNDYLKSCGIEPIDWQIKNI